jgi:glycosyltransferase involved in cell wall biosynthesis
VQVGGKQMTPGYQPLVSVIMIFLNEEQFMQEAIGSVLSQTYPNWELLLVDDGSARTCTQIALEYARRYPGRIRYLEHPDHQNRGMSASRNLGIRESLGKYLGFLDADDVYRPEKLAKQVAILESHPGAMMVYGETQHWYSWTRKPEDFGRDKLRRIGVVPDRLIHPPELIPLFLRQKAQTPGTCGVLIRREAIQQIGGFVEQFRGMFEDQIFFYKLCLNAPVYVESGSWDRYRQHPNSHTRASVKTGFYAYDKRPNQAYHNFLQWLGIYLVENKVTDIAIWQAYRREIWPYRHRHLYGLSSWVQKARGMPGKGLKWLASKLRSEPSEI